MKSGKDMTSAVGVIVIIFVGICIETSSARSGQDFLRFIQDLNEDFNSLKVEYANLVAEMNDLEMSLATQAEFLRNAVTGADKEELDYIIEEQSRKIEEMEARVKLQETTIDVLVEKERQRSLLHQGNDKIAVDVNSNGGRTQQKRHSVKRRWIESDATRQMPEKRDSNRVAFSAARTRVLLSEVHAQKVSFEHIFVDEGGSFDPTDGTFICRVPGVYYFVYTMRTFDGHYIGVLLMKNEEIQVSMQTDADDRSLMQSQSVLLSLQPGDEIYLRMSPSSSRNASFAIYDNHNNYVTFSGFLVM